MNGIDEAGPELKVAAVARRTGVSVRTLHYYEEIGLLSPSARTAAGHRLYTRADIQRLQQIRSMQQLGISLSQIHDCLREGKVNARRVVSEHLDRVRAERCALEALERQLALLQAHFEEVERDDLQSIELFLSTVEVITVFEKYFTDSQRARLKQHHETHGETVTPTVAALEKAMEASVAPESEQARVLMERFHEALDEVAGGDAAMLRAIRQLLHEQAAARRDHGISEELFGYMNRIPSGMDPGSR